MDDSTMAYNESQGWHFCEPGTISDFPEDGETVLCLVSSKKYRKNQLNYSPMLCTYTDYDMEPWDAYPITTDMKNITVHCWHRLPIWMNEDGEVIGDE